MHLLRRCIALTRLVNPFEAAWFKHPEDAPPGFLEPRFAYVVKAKDRRALARKG